MFAGVSEYIVLARKQETCTTTTLTLTKSNGSIPQFFPGQCLTVYFPDLSPTLGKQYSISSAPCEQVCTITVKTIGRFSNRLCSLAPGDRILASEPQGTFCPTWESNIVLLAGGMGITPFRGVIVQAVSLSLHPQIRLFYSAKILTDMPFGNELYEVSQRHSSFYMERFVTKEPIFSTELKCRRMRPDDILSNRDSQTQYLISGSLNFVLGIKNVLVTAGVERTQILTESYF